MEMMTDIVCGIRHRFPSAILNFRKKGIREKSGRPNLRRDTQLADGGGGRDQTE